MINEIKETLAKYNGEWRQEKDRLWVFSLTIAERKSFLSTKKLTFSARLRFDDASKTVLFSEMLTERGSGLSSTSGFGDEMSSGFGFKTESYNTMKPARTGTIEERSDLFGKKFEYKFNYKEIRQLIEEVVINSGYKFEYHVLPIK